MLTHDEMHDMLEDFVKTHEAFFGHQDGPILKCASCQKSHCKEPVVVEIRFPKFWEFPDGTTQDGIFCLCWPCIKRCFDGWYERR